MGGFFPELGKSLKPLGDAFIKLVKMMIAPIIFCTVVHGVASMSDMRKLGRVGVKTLIYFEAVSTLALVIGLIVVNLFKPGAGFDIDPKTLDPLAENVDSLVGELESLRQALGNVSGDPSESGPAERR